MFVPPQAGVPGVLPLVCLLQACPGGGGWGGLGSRTLFQLSSSSQPPMQSASGRRLVQTAKGRARSIASLWMEAKDPSDILLLLSLVFFHCA